MFKKGDDVEAVIMDIDVENERLSLSIKHLDEDPWETIVQRYPAGSKVTGAISSHADFGVFLKIEDGIEGLIHTSELGLEEGQSVDSEYAVGTEDEFRRAQKTQWQDYLDVAGLEGVSDWAREYIVNNFVDEGHFEDLLRNEVEYYVEDIKNEDSEDEEQWESRFDQEMEENNASDEEDFIEILMDGWSGGDAIEYYIGNYGEESFYNELSHGNNIDVDAVIDWLVDQDGDSIEGYEVEATEIDDQWYYVVQID